MTLHIKPSHLYKWVRQLSQQADMTICDMWPAPMKQGTSCMAQVSNSTDTVAVINVTNRPYTGRNWISSPAVDQVWDQHAHGHWLDSTVAIHLGTIREITQWSSTAIPWQKDKFDSLVPFLTIYNSHLAALYYFQLFFTYNLKLQNLSRML